MYGIVGWHRRRVAQGRRGVHSWYFIALSCVVAVLAVGGAAYGIGLRSSVVEAKPEKQPETTKGERLKTPIST